MQESWFDPYLQYFMSDWCPQCFDRMVPLKDGLSVSPWSGSYFNEALRQNIYDSLQCFLLYCRMLKSDGFVMTPSRFITIYIRGPCPKTQTHLGPNWLRSMVAQISYSRQEGFLHCAVREETRYPESWVLRDPLTSLPLSLSCLTRRVSASLVFLFVCEVRCLSDLWGRLFQS
jgi:hypothetical protein